MIKLNDNVINIGNFPDGTMLIKQAAPEDEKITISWFYEDDKELIALIYLVNHLKDHGKDNVHLYMPYIPNTSFSCVLDSYDYWNVIDNILPELHDEILAHNGCMLMRGDSGDCVEVVTKTVFKLWDQFGGTVNSKGYKVLDPHVKAIYGDSITVQRCEEIYEILKNAGFACSNVALGVGSFSMHCIEEDSILKPFTRDTFSSCIKACYAEVDGKCYPVFKNPKEGGFKKSQKGLCYVYEENGELKYKDEYTSENIPEGNLLETVFKDGKMIKDYTLNEIRQRLNGGEF